jgi:hypothetical protein
MVKFKVFVILLFASLCIVSCNSSEEDNKVLPKINLSESIGNTVLKDFMGQVVDENNVPIQNVDIKIGVSTAKTDINGVFVLKNANVHERFAFIISKKVGFIDGSRAVVPTDGINRVKIMMLSDNVSSTVNAGSVSNVVLANGTKVIFDGDFKTDSGIPYSGTVSVIMHHLDPSNPNTKDKMPGMLFAENANGEARLLETFGMMNVELRGSGGQKLQIKNSAQIEMPITASQLATAPASIPLWHFDETLGYWKEEGSATKQGNKYVGKVSHFSWWNCDAQFPTITLSLKVVNSNGDPISNAGVGIIRNGNNFPAIQYTNSGGQVCGLVPANEIVTMNIYDTCGNVVKTSSVGPFSSNTTLPNVVLTETMVQSTTVQGSLLKCDKTRITDGYVALNYGNQTLFSTVTNGDFSFKTLVCSANNVNFTLQGFDYENLQKTGVINYTFTTPITNIGNLSACNNITEFISYQIDNNPVKYFISSIKAAYSSNGLSISGYSNQEAVFLYGTANAVGTYSSSQLAIENGEILVQKGVVNNVVFQITKLGIVGEYIDLTFNGNYDSAGVSRRVTGIVHVLRDN